MPEFFPFYIATFIVSPSPALRRVKRNLRSPRPSPNQESQVASDREERAALFFFFFFFFWISHAHLFPFFTAPSAAEEQQTKKPLSCKSSFPIFFLALKLLFLLLLLFSLLLVPCGDIGTTRGKNQEEEEEEEGHARRRRSWVLYNPGGPDPFFARSWSTLTLLHCSLFRYRFQQICSSKKKAPGRVFLLQGYIVVQIWKFSS